VNTRCAKILQAGLEGIERRIVRLGSLWNAAEDETALKLDKILTRWRQMKDLIDAALDILKAN
jgi:hypothetical protein